MTWLPPSREGKFHRMPPPPLQGIHMTWLPLSREGKFHRMRDGMLYHDAPEYYSGPKFLAAGRAVTVRHVGSRWGVGSWSLE